MDAATTLTLITGVFLVLQSFLVDGRLPKVTLGSHLIHRNLQEIKTNVSPAPQRLKRHKDVCAEGASCVLPVQCPAHVRDEERQICTALGGRQGICCSSGRNLTIFAPRTGRGHHEFVRVDPMTLGVITRHSRVEVAELHMREARLLASGRATILSPSSASYAHFRNSRPFSITDLSDVMNVANRALEIALATRFFKEKQGITNEQLEMGMLEQNLRTTPLGSACAPVPHCPMVAPRYRRIDGACNNLYNSAWGSALTAYSRILPPMYQDGIWAPRVSEDNGQPLSSPRLISSTVFEDEDKPNEDYTLLLMQYGQFIGHEVSHSFDTSYANGSAISCCTVDGSHELPHQFRHFACMPIIIPPKDPFYSAFKQGCMSFVRSVLAPRQDCTLGYAQQMNKVTHFLDGSAIYGSSPEQTGELRSFYGGRLKVFKDYGRDLLPLSKDPEACLTMEQGSACFASGDTRTNQMVSLVVIHTVFMREHNRIADELQRLNPHWNDEQLFLEARRILTAEFQVITYKEFLPAVIGEIAMAEFELNIGYGPDYSYDYDPAIDPSIINEFAAAAFRFGHSMVDGLMKVYGRTKMEEIISLPEVMFHPSRMRKRQFYDELLSTLTTEPIQEIDVSVSDALTKYMFRGGNPYGVDIASINIQRGRDHGLRPYNDYRALVGQPRITNFEAFGPKLAEKLKAVYASVDDIDLWVGGLLEPKAPGAILGITFRDIVAEQFSRLKRGDKYFVDHDPSINPGYFTPDQIQELKRVTMSRLICDNSDGILLARQAINAFRKPGVQGNEFVDCGSNAIPRLNLQLWQEIQEEKKAV